MSRADRITPRSVQSEYYSDFLIDFDLNPISGELARVSNERSVVRAMKNLINTSRGERFFHSNIGCDLKRMLFEPMDETSRDIIRTMIVSTIEQHEPRVVLREVDVQAREELNIYNVGITFALANAPSQVFAFNTVLKRVR